MIKAVNSVCKFFCPLFSACFLLLACSSNDFYVPGEKNQRIEGIYSEYFNIAEEYFALKNYSKALEFYKIARQNKKLKKSAYYNMARCYAFTGEWAESIKIFEIFLKHDPANSNIKASLAYVYAMSGDYETSRRLYEELQISEPDVCDHLENYIMLLFAMEEYQVASVKIKILEEKFPDSEKIKEYQEKINGSLPEENSEENAKE